MSNIALQLVWVAAVLGLRKHKGTKAEKRPLWDATYDLWDALSHPPFPYKKP